MVSDEVLNEAIESLKEIVAMSSEPLKIEKLEEVIASLLKQRSEFLRKSGEWIPDGFHPNYYVFDNVADRVDDETFVLSPYKSVQDYRALVNYAKSLSKGDLRNYMFRWLDSIKEDLCIERVDFECPIYGSLCCAKCPEQECVCPEYYCGKLNKKAKVKCNEIS